MSRYQKDKMIYHAFIEAIRFRINRAFSRSQVWPVHIHPIWVRGSLVSHMPIAGAEMIYRIAHPRADGTLIEHWDNNID